MAINKQEFYEGAALHRLARTGHITSIRYEDPVFVLNNRLLVHFKHNTRSRSPWGFTFTPEEQVLLQQRASDSELVIGFVCGGDGVAVLPYDAYHSVAAPRNAAI